MPGAAAVILRTGRITAEAAEVITEVVTAAMHAHPATMPAPTAVIPQTGKTSAEAALGGLVRPAPTLLVVAAFGAEELVALPGTMPSRASATQIADAGYLNDLALGVMFSATHNCFLHHQQRAEPAESAIRSKIQQY